MELVKGRLADAMPLIMAHRYTRRRTADPMHVFLWQLDGATKAAAVFTSPINRYFGKGAIELARLVRTPDLNVPLSGFVGACLRWLREHTELLYCLSYADQTVGHHGGIYQACSFLYVAESKGNTQYRNDVTGQIISGRSFDQHAADNKTGWTRLRTGKKHLYVKPLHERAKKLLARFGWTPLPYPKPGAAKMTHLDDAFLDQLAAYGPIGKTLGMVIRPAFIAPKGKTYVWGDWSAIEARVLPWLADSRGARKQLEIFKASDADKTLPDVYVYNAAQLLGVDPQVMWNAFLEGEKWAKDGRQSHGKVPVLSLGFGGAVGALMKMAINYGVYLSEEQAKTMVEGWRAANMWAKEFWGCFKTDRHTGEVVEATGLWGAANMALRNPGEAFPAGRVAYAFDPDYLGGTLFCALPCGRLLTYPHCKYKTHTVKDKDTGEEEDVFALWFRKGYGWSSIWYGRLAENCTQATAGSILRETLVSLDLDASEWMPVVSHTHDEIITEVSDAPAEIDRARRLLERHMLKAPEWRADLPLAVEVTENWYYTKAPIKH